MRYAISFSNAGVCSDPRILAELAQLAEQASWDGIFLEDYIVHWSAPSTPTCDPWVALAAMAARTEHIRLGTMVTPLSRRRPWKLARETITLDQLSNGRLILGAGLGDINDPGFVKTGEVIDARQRAHMLDEALAILAGLWSGQPFAYQGEHYQIDEVTFLPGPVQSSRIPIWIGGAWPNSGPVRRAARWDGACLYHSTPDGSWQDMSPDDVRALKAAIQSQRTSSEPFDISIGGRRRGEDWEKERETIRSLAEAGATWWVEYVPPTDLGTLQQSTLRGPLRIE